MWIKALTFFPQKRKKSKCERAKIRTNIYHHHGGEGPSMFQGKKGIIKEVDFTVDFTM